MNGNHILAIYEDISRTTRRMLAAARGDDWDALVALETDCSAMFARLFETEDGALRDTEFQRRKGELIRGVLADDAQIRLLVEPWLAQLTTMIGSTRQQSRLNEAYETAAGH